MGTFAKKYFFVFTLLAIALGALLAAKTVNHVIEAEVFLEGENAIPVPTSKPGKRAAKPKVQRSQDVTAILQRNVFCSECPPIVPQPELEDEPTSNDPVPTSLPIQLVATMVSDDPNWSFAAIRNTAEERTSLLGIAAPLRGAPGVIVTSIETKRVFLENSGRPEYVDLEGAGGEPPPPRSTRPASSKDALAKDIEAGVRKTGDDKYEVDRELISKFLGAPQTLARSARIVPSVKDGQPNGFRLYAIRPGSPYAKIGLQNGDTVHAINGQEITTPDKALEVYTKVRNASHITVNLTRRGKPMTLDYTIR